MSDKPCRHYLGDGRYCGAAPTRNYLPGDRCPEHTPARLAGHDEPGQTIGMYQPTPMRVHALPASTLIDDRAVASGRRRSNQHDYAEARTRLGIIDAPTGDRP